ncbi:hypothetical protein OPKNFCMD_1774 [Methylobacterium crusticola]|uniref:SlyX family protein n=1 Tax=Methylobacterium crusticola TaxID=1697972 RepID=A0ABQ4QWD4_9HYPH|nr:hypothetical protein [Methylobacterium crusticola]GJD49045.1 hypothetical protein OPKNFCMD_1774 [Methylobacterium crusticola]
MATDTLSQQVHQALSQTSAEAKQEALIGVLVKAVQQIDALQTRVAELETRLGGISGGYPEAERGPALRS